MADDDQNGSIVFVGEHLWPRPDDAPAPDGALSPSQISCLECPRKWGFRYLDKIETPDLPSAAAGTAIHACVEEYYRTGVILNALSWHARVATAALAYLPPYAARPHSEHIVEGLACAGGVFGRSTSAGADVTGREVRIDVYDPHRRSSFVIGPEGREWSRVDRKGRPVPLVCDLKTTGDFKWQATVVKLRGDGHGRGMDAQVLVYGKKAIVDFIAAYGEAPDEIHCRWVYALRDEQKPRARVTDFVVTPTEIAAAEQEWSVPVRAIRLFRSLFRQRGFGSTQLPVNVSVCEKFGGCGYGPGSSRNPGLNICQLTDEEEMRRIMPNDTESLNSLLARFQTGVAAQAPAAQVAATATTPPSLPPGNFGTDPTVFTPPAPAPMAMQPAAPAAPVTWVVEPEVAQMTAAILARVGPWPSSPTMPVLDTGVVKSLMHLATLEKRLEFIVFIETTAKLTTPEQSAYLKAAVTPPEAPRAQVQAATEQALAATTPPTRGKPGRPRKNAAQEDSGPSDAAPAAVTLASVSTALVPRLEKAIAVGLRAAADYLEHGDG